MYGKAANYGRAGAHYRNVDVSTRIEGASPHRLVGILFEELLTSIATTRAAITRNDAARRSEGHSRALAILQALESSLDFERGGEMASMLSSVYREATRLVLKGVRDSDFAAIDEARKMIGEITMAWDAIGG